MSFNLEDIKIEKIYRDINRSELFIVRDPYKITDVEVKNGRVVIATFADGSKTKAVCQPEDNFDLYMGIAVCLIKKKYSPIFTPDGIEHRAKECRYYTEEDKKIKKAIKLYNRKLKEEEKNKRIELEREAARVRRMPQSHFLWDLV